MNGGLIFFGLFVDCRKVCGAALGFGDLGGVGPR